MKKIKKGYVLALAVLLLLPCLRIIQAQAAGGVNINEDKCSLTISVGIGEIAGSNDVYLPDFNSMDIQVSVYRVAKVDATGQNFTPIGSFVGMDFSKISKDPSSVKAEVWRELAEDAVKMIPAAGNVQKDEDEVIRNVTLKNGQDGIIDNLLTGLYLVVPEDAFNQDYSVQYTFTPYLTALPDHTVDANGKDAWNYTTQIGLKPQANPQLGRLKITKVLETYNESLGPATFVFRITGRDNKDIVKYEEVVSMTYTAAETQEIEIKNIPVGLEVTVEEVYSGASYELVNPKEKTVTVTIWSDAAINAGKEDAAEASVTFRNHYSGGNRSGYGVTNQFVSDGVDSDGKRKWTWENPTRKEPQ